MLSFAESPEDLIARINQLKWPTYDSSKESDQIYQKEYYISVETYKRKLSALVLEFADAYPNHQQLPNLLLRRWRQCDAVFMTRDVMRPMDFILDAKRIRKLVGGDAILACDYMIALKSAEHGGQLPGEPVIIGRDYLKTNPPEAYAKSYLNAIVWSTKVQTADAIWHGEEFVRRFGGPDQDSEESSDIEDIQARLHRLKLVGKPLRIQFTDGFTGKPFDSHDFLGRVVLVDFTAMSCGPCVENKPRLKKLVDQYAPQGLVACSIAGDTQAEVAGHKALREQHGITWPAAIEGAHWSGPLFEKFKIRVLPTMFLIDRKGNLRVIDSWNPEIEIQKLLAEDS